MFNRVESEKSVILTILNGFTFSLLLVASGVAGAASAAGAVGRRGIFNTLPDMPQHGPTEAQCIALKNASLTYIAQIAGVGAPLTAQLTKAAEDLQQKMASRVMPPHDAIWNLKCGLVQLDRR